MAEPKDGIPKDRLDALTDGVFAFAMTLLVLNLEIPDDFNPHSSAELLSEFGNLLSALLVYVISFAVLAVFWFGQTHKEGEPEVASGAHAWAVAALLFFTTVMPFSTQVVGRFDLAPAVWLYAANMILLSLSALAISLVAEKETGVRLIDSGRIDLAVLIAAALLSSIIAIFTTKGAMWAYMLNFAAGPLKRYFGAR